MDKCVRDYRTAEALYHFDCRYEVVTDSEYDPRDSPDRQRILFNGPAGFVQVKTSKIWLEQEVFS
jgi:hypothetical protein